MSGRPLLSIGELSKVVSLSVKTLRLYHERGLLDPTWIDPSTGYRYYDARGVETARFIAMLRRFEFSLEQIGEVLESCNEEGDLLAHFEKHLQSVERKIAHYAKIRRALTETITRELRASAGALPEVEEKTVPDLLVASIRALGAYVETGGRLARLQRAAGRFVCGAPLNLYYDDEMKEEDADFETCLPIRQAPNDINKTGVTIRTLEGGRGLCLVHRGPYEQLGRSYERLFCAARARGASLLQPSREIYVKGPGLLFKGNPERYETEVQLFLA